MVPVYLFFRANCGVFPKLGSRKMKLAELLFEPLSEHLSQFINYEWCWFVQISSVCSVADIFLALRSWRGQLKRTGVVITQVFSDAWDVYLALYMLGVIEGGDLEGQQRQ